MEFLSAININSHKVHFKDETFQSSKLEPENLTNTLSLLSKLMNQLLLKNCGLFSSFLESTFY
jgi:hypothetical protein